MRADRLVATLLLMQARGRVTAGEIADELEVSVATARRDLEALSAAGVPVYSQAGRGGGWSLVGGARTDLTGLTSGEAKALFLLAGPVASVDSTTRSALHKLGQALPEVFRAEARAAATAVAVDPTPWGHSERLRPGLVDELQNAVIARRKVLLEYQNRLHDRTRRVVDPWGLIDKNGAWYLVAGTETGQRTFRVDRILKASMTDLVAQRPSDFALARAWDQIVDEVERHRSSLWATILIDADCLTVLATQFGRHCEPLARHDQRRTRVRVAAPTARAIAEQLAGWGATVEVLEPEAVKDELARLGVELVQRYPPR